MKAFQGLPGDRQAATLNWLVGALNWLVGALADDTRVWSGDVWVVDSTPVECVRSRDTVRRSDLADWAAYGYCTSDSRYFWGCACRWSRPCTGCPSDGQG